MRRKLYGLPTLLILIVLLAATVYYRFVDFQGLKAFVWRLPFDLKIYLLAGQDVAHGGELYDAAYIDRYPFTYPPFAAAIFEAVSRIPEHLLIWLWPAATGAAMFALFLLIFRERGLRLTPLACLTALGLAGLTAATEPVHGTLFYGQVNVFLMVLVGLDILPRRLPLPGLGIGLAAGIKLTPAYLGLVLLFQRRWWAAVGAAITFAVTVVAGYLLIPDAHVFWTEKMFNSSRVGDHTNPGAMSLRSVMVRVTGEEDALPWILAVMGVILLTCLALRTAYRRANFSAGLVLTGLSACLVSPFSWYHHYVWCAPLGAVIFVAVNQALGARLPGRFGSQLAGLASLAAFLAVELPFVCRPVIPALSYHRLNDIAALWPWNTMIYPLVALVAIGAYAAWGFIAPSLRADDEPDASAHPAASGLRLPVA